MCLVYSQRWICGRHHYPPLQKSSYFWLKYIELNPAFCGIAFSKLPDSCYNSELFTLKFLIMRKKSGFSIVEQAIALVFEFEKVYRKLKQNLTLPGQSKSTLQNYIRRIALFVVYPLQTAPKSTIIYLCQGIPVLGYLKTKKR